MTLTVDCEHEPVNLDKVLVVIPVQRRVDVVMLLHLVEVEHTNGARSTQTTKTTT